MIRSSFQTMHPLLKVVFFACIVLMLVSTSAGVGIALSSWICGTHMSDLQSITTEPFDEIKVCALRIINASNQIIGFLGASFLFLLIMGKRSVNSFWTGVPRSTILLVPFLAMFSMPLIQASFEINNALIPAGSYLESLLKPSEDNLAKMTEVLLSMNSISEYLLMLFVVAILPALGEEFVFRGVVQSQLAKTFKNIHVGIWTSAFVFSFIHFQFYGFLPRMLLGAFFGYLLVHTGSIWSSVLAHFVNNAMAVTAAYFAGSASIGEAQMEEAALNPLLLLLSALIFSLMFWVVIQKSKWDIVKPEYLHRLTTSNSPSTEDRQEL